MERWALVFGKGVAQFPRTTGIVMALVLGATLGILNLTSAQSLTWLGTLSGHESGA